MNGPTGVSGYSGSTGSSSGSFEFNYYPSGTSGACGTSGTSGYSNIFYSNATSSSYSMSDIGLLNNAAPRKKSLSRYGNEVRFKRGLIV